MAVHIIIDGYNLIKRSPVLSRLDHMDIEKGRNELISRLVAYKKVKNHGITVVFDGCKGGGIKQERTRDRGINIIFSKKGEEADEVIKRVVKVAREKVVVVTSDRQIVDFSERRGAAVIPSGEFEMRMEMAVFAREKGYNDELDDEPVNEAIHTQKKGPSKKLPKTQRRAMIKIKKL
ncbi:MAG: NYN domain-containing protein [Thermodesulfobacteriota bacterium]